VTDHPLWPTDLDARLDDAQRRGFDGFGGHCFAAALALRQVYFANEPAVRLVGAFNAALYPTHALGHVALELTGAGEPVYLDADGEPKAWEDIESWGMLAPDDPDYQALADEVGVAWTDEAANDVIRQVLSVEQVLALAGGAEVAQAMLTLLDPDAASLPLPARRRIHRPR